MTYDEFKNDAAKLIYSPVAFNNFFFDGLSWTHPIRVAIYWYKFDKYLESNRTTKQPDAAVVATPQKPQSRFIKSLSARLSGLVHKGKKILDGVDFAVKLAGLSLFQKNKTLVFSYDDYEVTYGNKTYNPYCDNINIDEDTLKLCFPTNGKQAPIKKAAFKPVIITHWFHFYSRVKKISETDMSFLNELKEILDDNIWIYTKVHILETYHAYKFFTLILKATRPKQIYLYGSYNWYSMGLIAAAKKLNIKTIEQQHGIIMPGLFVYNYNYKSKSQLDFVCNQLDCFTEPLINWCKDNWTLHPDLFYTPKSPPYQVWQKFGAANPPKQLGELKKKINDRPVMTFGLTDLKIPAWLANFIVQNKHNYFFCFRLHPRYMSYNIDQIKELSSQLEHSDWELSSKLPLFDLMSVSGYFLSDGSTTLIDSLNFNLKTICFSEQFSKEIFKPYIEQNTILLAKNETDLLTAIGR